MTFSADNRALRLLHDMEQQASVLLREAREASELRTAAMTRLLLAVKHARSVVLAEGRAGHVAREELLRIQRASRAGAR